MHRNGSFLFRLPGRNAGTFAFLFRPEQPEQFFIKCSKCFRSSVYSGARWFLNFWNRIKIVETTGVLNYLFFWQRKVIGPNLVYSWNSFASTTQTDHFGRFKQSVETNCSNRRFLCRIYILQCRTLTDIDRHWMIESKISFWQY